MKTKQHFYWALLIWACMSTIINAQDRNLQVVGVADQIGVIHTTSTGVTMSGLDLLRASAFDGTDWRIANVGGTLKIFDGIDNFSTSGTENLRLSSNGTLSLLQGGNAILANGSTGILVLGDPDGPNLGLDANGIIARNGKAADQLLLQTGPGMGDTYLNNLSGRVGIGTIVPRAKLSAEDSSWQLHLKNADDFNYEWYIGASKSSWTVGEGKLVFSPTSSSNDAMLVLNKEDDLVSVRNHRLSLLADPINDKDAVNLRTVNSLMDDLSSDLGANIEDVKDEIIAALNNTSLGLRIPIDLSPASPNDLTFAECAKYCRDLVDIGSDRWTIPSVEQLSHWAGGSSYNDFYWTSSASVAGYSTTEQNVTGGAEHLFPSLQPYRLTLNLFSGQLSANGTNVSTNCVCVR